MSKRPLNGSCIRQIIGAAVAVVFAATRALRADTYQWNGATANFTDPDWTDLAHPAIHTPPTTADDASYPSGIVTFSNNTTANATVSGATTFKLTGNYNVTSAVNVSAGLTLQNAGTLSAATLTQSSGSMHVANSSLNISGATTLNSEFDDAGGGTAQFGQLLLGTTGSVNNGVTFTGVTVSSGSSGIDTVGLASGATSSLIVDSSPWTATGGFKIGLDGVGTFTVQNGATVSNTATPVGSDLFIGGYVDPDTTQHLGTGTVLVTGPTSQWTDAKGIVSGDAGDGTLQALAGGQISAPSVLVAQYASATGRIELDGTSTSLTVAGSIEIGRLGNGEIIVTNGAAVTSATGSLATDVNSVGTVQLDGLNSSWKISGAMDMGQVGLAIGTITNGASLTVTGTSTLGDQSVSSATLEINGTDSFTSAPSTYNYGGDLHVGESGFAEMDIQAGGLVQPTSGGGGVVAVAAQPGGFGVLTVDALGSLLKTSNFYVGGTAGTLGGTGQATLTNDGTTSVANSMKIWTGSTVDVSGGGHVIVGSGSAASGILEVNTGGTLSGGGTLIGNLLANAGTVSPGDNIGVLTIQGNTQENAAATIEMQVAGTLSSQYDQLDTTGSLNIGGEVLVDFSFLPVAGDTFELFTDGTTPNFTPNTQFEGVGPGLLYQWIPVTGGWDLKLLNNAVPVPEPTSILLPVSILALLRRRRTKKTSAARN